MFGDMGSFAVQNPYDVFYFPLKLETSNYESPCIHQIYTEFSFSFEYIKVNNSQIYFHLENKIAPTYLSGIRVFTKL